MSDVDGDIRPELTALSVPLGELTLHPRNARRGNVAGIADSLRQHAQYRPIIYQLSTGHVLAGNHTLAAARELGWTHIAAVGLDVDDDQATRIVLVDNKTADDADYDQQLLLDVLEGLDELTGTGYSSMDLAQLAADLQAVDADDVDTFPAAGDAAEDPVSELWGVIITCDDETQQTELLERLSAEGLRVRAVVTS